MFRANPNILHDVAVPMGSANNDLQSTIRIVTSLLYLSLPHSTFLTLPYSTIPNFYSTTTSTCTPTASTQLYSTPLYSILLYSTPPLLYSALLCSALLSSTSTSTFLCSAIFSSLPLLYLYAGADWTQ